MTHHGTKRYIDSLENVIESYNSARHSYLGCSPNKAELPEMRMPLLERFEKRYAALPKQKAVYFPGQIVRILRWKTPFDRSYNVRHSYEPFRVHSVDVRFKVPLYHLESFDRKEQLVGAFRADELIPMLASTNFKIDKVLKEKGNFLYVSFIGLPKTEAFLRWVPKRDTPWYQPLDNSVDAKTNSNNDSTN